MFIRSEPVYQAKTLELAGLRLDRFDEEWGNKYRYTEYFYGIRLLPKSTRNVEPTSGVLATLMFPPKLFI